MNRGWQGSGLHEMGLRAMLEKDTAIGRTRTYYISMDIWVQLGCPESDLARFVIDNTLAPHRYFVESNHAEDQQQPDQQEIVKAVTERADTDHLSEAA